MADAEAEAEVDVVEGEADADGVSRVVKAWISCAWVDRGVLA